MRLAYRNISPCIAPDALGGTHPLPICSCVRFGTGSTTGAGAVVPKGTIPPPSHPVLGVPGRWMWVTPGAEEDQRVDKTPDDFQSQGAEVRETAS